jgi:type VI secretion system protein ImpC
MGESTQHRISKIRPPRVQITYDVEIGGAIVKKEIPFVVGILADLSGINNDKLPPIKERKFVEIDRDNFGNVMQAYQPALTLKVKNWYSTSGLRIYKVLRELFEAVCLMNPRSAKTYLFHNADKLLSDALATISGDIQKAEDVLKPLDKAVKEAKDKAQVPADAVIAAEAALKAAADDAAKKQAQTDLDKAQADLKTALDAVKTAEDNAAKEVVKTIDYYLKLIRDKADNSGELDQSGNEFLKKFNKFLKVSRECLGSLDATVRPKVDGITKSILDAPVQISSGSFEKKPVDDALESFKTIILNSAAEMGSSFKFNNLDDFGPLRVLQQTDELLSCYHDKQYVFDLMNKLDGNSEAMKFVVNCLNDTTIDDKTKFSAKIINALTGGDPSKADPTTLSYVTKILERFFEIYQTDFLVKEYTQPFELEPNHLMRLMMEYIAMQNEKLVDQVNEFLHHPDFQKLEASWSALNFLVKNTATSDRLKLRLLNISKMELQKDLEKAIEFDQSQLFKKVYEEEYGTFGGNPYGILLGDYEFDRSAKDLSLLTMISNVAAAAHAPFISAASPALFGLNSFTELDEPRDLKGIFESQDMIKWNSFRDSEDSRYVALTLPSMLMRLPYGPTTLPVEGFDFTENTDGRDHKKYLWANSAFALVGRITDAFFNYSWCAAIRGVEGGGVVENLPAHVFSTDSGDRILKCPTEIAITDRREKELSDLGFISLVHCKGKDFAAFFGGQTTQLPKKYDTPLANSNARLSTVLPYIIAASRFAHYLKVIVRDKVGSFLSADNVQVYLNRWIGGYVLGKDDAGQEIKAQYPLREARVDVSDTPGKPGCYTAVVFLRPHFQLEELTTSIRLVAELPPPAAK